MASTELVFSEDKPIIEPVVHAGTVWLINMQLMYPAPAGQLGVTWTFSLSPGMALYMTVRAGVEGTAGSTESLDSRHFTVLRLSLVFW